MPLGVVAKNVEEEVILGMISKLYSTLKVLNIPSFRTKRGGDPDSSVIDGDSFWTTVFTGVTVYFIRLINAICAQGLR